MAPFALGVRTSFAAQHFLVGGDFGPEGELHAHDYRVEVVLEGESLDEHGFVADIVRVKAALSQLSDRYRDRVLNELPEFAGLNPGCEIFARVFAESMRDELQGESASHLTAKIWENAEAWASYRLALKRKN